jgi:hypothetical protein
MIATRRLQALKPVTPTAPTESKITTSFDRTSEVQPRECGAFCKPNKRQLPNRQLGLEPRYTARKFRPYALAIGEATLLWNDLYEEVEMLFWTVSGGGFATRQRGPVVRTPAQNRKPARARSRYNVQAGAILGYGFLAQASGELRCAGLPPVAARAQGLAHGVQQCLHAPLLRYRLREPNRTHLFQILPRIT